jgi:hypothetical protein
MIAAVTLRLLCLIFQQVLGLVLLMVPTASTKDQHGRGGPLLSAALSEDVRVTAAAGVGDG